MSSITAVSLYYMRVLTNIGVFDSYMKEVLCYIHISEKAIHFAIGISYSCLIAVTYERDSII